MLESSKFDCPILTEHNSTPCQTDFNEIFRELSEYIGLLTCKIVFNYF